MPIILGSSQVSVQSDANGFATIQPSTGGFPGALLILGTTSGGTSALQFELQSLTPLANQPAAPSQEEVNEQCRSRWCAEGDRVEW
jgi:hypothetical protein